MSTNPATGPGPEVLAILEETRRGYVQGDLAAYERYFADDVVVMGIGDDRIHVGKASALEYLRTALQKGWMHEARADFEHVKQIGNVYVVSERYTTRYVVKGKSFQDNGRATSIVSFRGGRWELTHLHLETLATNPTA